METLKFILGSMLVGLIGVLPIYIPIFTIKNYRSAKRRGLKPAISPGIWATIFAIFILILLLPSTLRFSARARSSEASFNLFILTKAADAYLKEHKQMPVPKDDEIFFELIKWKPDLPNLNKFDYYCGKDKMKSEVYDHPDLTNNWPLPIKPTVSEKEIMCFAVGNIDADEFLDIWSIDMSKIPVHQVADIDDIVFYGKTPRQIWYLSHRVELALLCGIIIDLILILIIDARIRKYLQQKTLKDVPIV